jgi:hypothetical protein
MPAAPIWYTRIPDIITVLQKGLWQQISRSTLQRLLGIEARRAQQLMRTMRTHKCGNMVFVERCDLLEWLEALQAGDEVGREWRRREHIETALMEMHLDLLARRHQIYTPEQAPAIRAASLEQLADTTVLRPGELQIQFTGMQDLMQQLFQLSRALANDYTAIERLLNPELQA